MTADTRETRRFQAGAQDDGVRLDAFLAEKLSGLVADDEARVTRSRVQKWIEDGRVTLDGKRAKASAKLKAGAIACVDIPEPKPLALAAEEIPLEVLHEDSDVIVVNKAAGISTHPGAGRDSGTLVNALLARVPDLSGIGDALRPGIVHRLDKDTTGVLVVAKSELAHQSLSRQFHDHSAKRRYRALVWGRPPAALTIDARLGRDPRDRKKFAVVAAPHGKRAVTHVTRVEELGPATLVECALETGRTHQIRVHLAHEGFPLVGDATYGGGRAPKGASAAVREAAATATRQMLHAGVLGFEHPRTRAWIELTAPIPADMAAVVDAFRRLR